MYSSTKLRYDGTYFILSRYPYYAIDTVEVEVRDGQVIGAVPELRSQRLLKMEIFADSTIYHSLESRMLFDIIITNLNCDSTIWLFPCDSLTAPNTGPGAVAIPADYAQFLIPRDDVSKALFASDPNITFLGCLPACQVHQTYQSRLLINFGDAATLITPDTGTYYLYLKGQSWSRYGAWYPHYEKCRHWWFKVSEPTIIDANFE